MSCGRGSINSTCFPLLFFCACIVLYYYWFSFCITDVAATGLILQPWLYFMVCHPTFIGLRWWWLSRGDCHICPKAPLKRTISYQWLIPYYGTDHTCWCVLLRFGKLPYQYKPKIIKHRIALNVCFCCWGGCFLCAEWINGLWQCPS